MGNISGLVIGALSFIVVGLALWIVRIEKRMRGLLRGGRAENLAGTLAALDQDIRAFASFQAETKRHLESVEERLARSIQSVSTVRYQAFKSGGFGGNLSFSSAFLSEKGDGVIISGLYSRDLVGIYAKPVSNHASSYELTQEEKEAIQIARVEKSATRV